MREARLVQAFFYNNPDNYPPIVNGIRLLTEAHWKVELFCRDDGKDWGVSYPDTARVVRIKSQHGSSWRRYLSFIRTAIRHGSAEASAFLGHDMHGLLPARLLATRYRRPLLYQCHDFSERTPGEAMGGRVIRGFERLFARTARVVVIPDADRATAIARQLKLNQPPLVVANAPLRAASATNGSSLRKALIDQGRSFERIILRQGRIGPGHAIEMTIRSIPFWSSLEWGFVVMGLSDAGYVEHLKSIAKELKVERQFIVLPPVGYDQVPGFTKDADVGHALYEPIHINNLHIATASNKIMEYLAAGLPLVVSDTPALRRLTEVHHCGLVANEDHPASIALAINLLMGNQRLSAKMGIAATRAFETEFRFDLQFSPVIRMLETLARENQV